MDENIYGNRGDGEEETKNTNYGRYEDVSDDDTSDAPYRVDEANKIVRHNIYWAAGLGSVPIPLFDLVAISAIQLKMIKEISDLYEVPFSKNIAKSIIVSLLASIGSVGIARNFVCSLLKIVPGIGSVLACFSVPLTAGAFTYAVGKLFVMHFERGGTMLDLNTSKVKGAFSGLYEKGKDITNSTFGKNEGPQEA